MTEENEVVEVSDDATDAVEKEAKQYGHISYDDWVKSGKDPSDYVGAKAFMKVGGLYGKINTQTNELSEMKSAFRTLTDKLLKAEENAYKKALSDLKNEYKEALRIGDESRAETIEKQIEDTKNVLITNEQQAKTQAETVKMAPEPPVEVKQWIEDRSRIWFNDATPLNAEMRLKAGMLDDMEKMMNPNIPLVERFNRVEDQIKKLYPHHPAFMKDEKVMAKETRAPLIQGGKQAPISKDVGRRFEDLKYEDRKLIENMCKSTGMKKEDYIKELEKLGVLK